MRILHIENYFDPTAGYQINELLYAGKEFKDEVFLITSNDMTPFHKTIDISKDKEYEKNVGVTIYRLNMGFKISSRIIMQNFKETINKINPDIVFMHGIGDFKDLQLWRKKTSYKIVRDCHMSWVASKNKFRNVYFLLFRLLFAPIINRTNKYDVIYALGNEEYEYLRKLGIKNEKIEYLRHGYNEKLMFFSANGRKCIREKYNFLDNDIVISYIGKFNSKKQPDLIFDIINKLDKEYIIRNNIKLLFIGPKDEKYMIIFNKKLKTVKYKNNIVIDESILYNDLHKYYSASDICIFPKETTLSSIHAQVCGCPVIMENHTSNRERVVDNRNLYENANYNEAAEILGRIIDNKEYTQNKYIENLNDREYNNQIKLLKERVVGFN